MKETQKKWHEPQIQIITPAELKKVVSASACSFFTSCGDALNSKIIIKSEL